MKRKTQETIAAFAATGILIGALCGFVAVDLSTGLYMPEEIGPLFAISRLDSTGISLGILGQEYAFSSDSMDGVRETLWRFRGLLPHSVTVTGNLTTRLYVAAQEQLDAVSDPEEPW